MKVTSLKDMDSYIYSTVVLPLKELDVDSLAISSPMSQNDRVIELYLRREETGHVRYDHNFERDEARDSALDLVWMRCGNVKKVVADYNRKNHAINIYAPAFGHFGKGEFLMKRLIQAFGNYTPFGRLEIKDTTRDGYKGGVHATELNAYGYAVVEDEESEDYDD